MQNGKVQSALIIALLVGLGAAARLLPLPANLQAVGAIALFAGFYFHQQRLLAFCIPLAIMLFSNILIGGYDFWQMLLINLAISLPALVGHRLRGQIEISERFAAYTAWLRPALKTLRVAAYSIGGSLVFFAASNFGVWLFGGLYAHTFEGLVLCYLMAIPFYGADHSMVYLGGTVVGDLGFNALLFGLYALATMLVREPAAEKSAV
jgi:hypothetical protein